jgi:hypothetical protein
MTLLWWQLVNGSFMTVKQRKIHVTEIWLTWASDSPEFHHEQGSAVSVSSLSPGWGLLMSLVNRCWPKNLLEIPLQHYFMLSSYFQ